MELTPGIYEKLINEALKKKLENLPAEYRIHYINIDPSQAPRMLTNYVASMMNNLLSNDEVFPELKDKISFVNKVVEFIHQWEINPDDDLLTNEKKLLGGIFSSIDRTEKQLKALENSRPRSGFTFNTLFTGSNHDLSIQNEINRDIISADEIYWIVAFIRFTGVRIFESSLRQFLQNDGARLHIITTTYMGASEPKAVEFLKNLDPEKVEIRVSYNNRNERLHAKSYIFVRHSGLSTAYIGSSNLSHSALTDGLEWNVRVTSVESPQIVKASIVTFETYWNRPDFEPYDRDKFREAISENQKTFGEAEILLQKYTIRPEQKEILEKLTVEREIHQSFKNLVVAATGTGKTVIAAFDYQRFRDEHQQNNNLLFIVHREEILEQSIATFRSVLEDEKFGELWVGSHQPSFKSELNHLFVSIQTFNSNKERFQRLGENHYDFIIIDEAHHSTAESYRQLFTMFRPKILLGLTATPERADGKSLLPDFNNRIAAEMRLPEAINRLLLSPFQYFCIGDKTVDLSQVKWNAAAGSYDEDELFRKLNTEGRLNLILGTIPHYLSDEHHCHALCFCCRKEHAEDTALGLRKAGYNAEALTSDDSTEDRKKKITRFKGGEINYLCVVDIFNEGVDIPGIDTVLFLRPTKSLTVFLQQLGRGLRLAPGKDCLTVLDYVAQANKKYSFESRIRALVGKNISNRLEDQVAKGFTYLPRGCAIEMDKLAQQYILDNIQGAIWNSRRLINNEVMHYRQNFKDELTLSNFLAHFNLDPRALYKSTCWSELLRNGNELSYEDDAYTDVFAKNMWRLVHVNSIGYIRFMQKLISDGFTYEHNKVNDIYALMLYYALYAAPLPKSGVGSVEEGLRIFGAHQCFVEELRELLDYIVNNLNVNTRLIPELGGLPLELFGCYSRDEQLIIFGETTDQQMMSERSGVHKINRLNTDLLWVTLNKSDKDFSERTQYNDYAINESLFHWQSKNDESHTNSGSRYVRQKENHKTFLLFVRENKKDGYGLTEPYYFLGPVTYRSSQGDQPMSITWEMKYHMPVFILDKAMKQAVG